MAMFENSSPWLFETAATGHTLSPRLLACFQGRYKGRDGREHACRTIGMSPECIAVYSDHVPEVGESIELYLDEHGRFEGTVVLCFANGFTMNFEATSRRRERIAIQLACLSRREEVNGAELRRHERIVPFRAETTITLRRETFPCEIKNISRSGALIATFVRTQIGARLILGRATTSEVVRLTGDGFAVQFMRLLPLEAFNRDLVL